jgi:RimJ/RimL family protein N-acetyltransferase
MAIRAPIEVTVICRPDQVGAARSLAAGSRHRVDIHGFVEDLPGLATEHDLVVSAAGTSVWDFACMGIPMALICAAANQRAGYDAMVASGLVVALGDAPYSDLSSRMSAIEGLLANTPVLEGLRRRLMALVDGLGAWRIVASWSQLLDIPRIPRFAPRLQARPAMTTDARLLFDWRNDPQTRAVSRTAGPLQWDQHVRWVEATIDDPLRQLLVIENETGDPIGTVRWDLGDEGWEVSITTAPFFRERGLGSAILAAGEKALVEPHAGRLLAAVHRDNEASRRLFARAGYLPHLPVDDDGFAVYAKWRFAA